MESKESEEESLIEVNFESGNESRCTKAIIKVEN